MKLLTVCTESHKKLLNDYFLPSVPKGFIPDVAYEEQIGSGLYDEDGFRLTTIKKLSNIVRKIKESAEPFVYADCDIVFNKNSDMLGAVNTLLQSDYDILAQRDGRNVCTGFMIIRPNRKTEMFFQAVVDLMNLPESRERIKKDINYHDQVAFNEFYASDSRKEIERPKVALLDARNGFGNLSHIQFGVIWEPNNDIFIKHGKQLSAQYLWHANFVVGVENKAKMLEQVRTYAFSN